MGFCLVLFGLDPAEPEGGAGMGRELAVDDGMGWVFPLELITGSTPGFAHVVVFSIVSLSSLSLPYPSNKRQKHTMAATSFKLNNGQEIPALGYGTWQAAPGQVQAAVEFALKDGYKLVDGAYCYGNEDEVGQGLKAAFDAGVKREDVFVMTKVWASYNTRCELALDKSLKSLGLDYVDLFLVVCFTSSSLVGVGLSGWLMVE